MSEPIPPGICRSIQRILEVDPVSEFDEDLLDELGEFRAAPSINRMFPHADTLHHLQAVTQDLAHQRHELDNDIAGLEAKVDDDLTRQLYEQLQADIASFKVEMASIRKQTTEAHHFIHSLTSKIKRLDVAKKNLHHSQEVLDAFDVLQSSHDQLATCVDTNNFELMQKTFEEIANIATIIRSHSSISSINVVWHDTQSYQTRLKMQLTNHLRSMSV